MNDPTKPWRAPYVAAHEAKPKLEDETVTSLRERAKGTVPGYSKMTKDELVEAIALRIGFGLEDG